MKLHGKNYTLDQNLGCVFGCNVDIIMSNSNISVDL